MHKSIKEQPSFQKATFDSEVGGYQVARTSGWTTASRGTFCLASLNENFFDA